MELGKTQNSMKNNKSSDRMLQNRLRRDIRK